MPSLASRVHPFSCRSIFRFVCHENTVAAAFPFNIRCKFSKVHCKRVKQVNKWRNTADNCRLIFHNDLKTIAYILLIKVKQSRTRLPNDRGDLLYTMVNVQRHKRPQDQNQSLDTGKMFECNFIRKIPKRITNFQTVKIKIFVLFSFVIQLESSEGKKFI